MPYRIKMCVPSNIARNPHWQAGFFSVVFVHAILHLNVCTLQYCNMCLCEQVLTINQVFDILVEVNSGRGWAKALKNNVPPKTGFVIKEEKDGDQSINGKGVQEKHGQDYQDGQEQHDQEQHDQDGEEDQGNQRELTNTVRHNGQPEMMDAVIKKQGCD